MSEENKENKENKVQIDIDEQTAQGVYSNLTLSNFSREEFVLDFAFVQPLVPKGKIRSRVILSPKNAKRLVAMLEENIQRYEEKVGPITDEKPNAGINLNFN